MFGLGTWEIVLILGVGLVVLGPDQLPSVARKVGRGLRDLRRAANDFTREIQSAEVEVTRVFDPPEGQLGQGDEAIPLEDVLEDEGPPDEEESFTTDEDLGLDRDPVVHADEDTNPLEPEPYADLYDPRAGRSKGQSGANPVTPTDSPSEDLDTNHDGATGLDESSTPS